MTAKRNGTFLRRGIPQSASTLNIGAHPGECGWAIPKTVQTLGFGDGFEGDTTAFTGALACMRAFVSAVGEACPAAPCLEMKAFHEDVTHRFGGIPVDGTRLMREHLAVAIPAGVGVSEVE